MQQRQGFRSRDGTQTDVDRRIQIRLHRLPFLDVEKKWATRLREQQCFERLRFYLLAASLVPCGCRAIRLFDRLELVQQGLVLGS